MGHRLPSLRHRHRRNGPRNPAMPGMRTQALLITAIVYLSWLPQASHSLPASSQAIPATRNAVGYDHWAPQSGTSTADATPSSSRHRRALREDRARDALHLQRGHSPSASPSYGVKVEMQRIETPCDGGRHGGDHQRLRCAVQRGSLRAQEVRKGPRARAAAGSKVGSTPVSTTAGGFTAPVAAARGEYLATVRLGTPERVFSVIVDTGSDLTWVQCSPCGKCYAQNDSLFLPNNSTSFTKLACGSEQCNGLPYPMCNQTTCVYWYSYGDGSLTTGDFVYDTITMDGINGQKQQVPNLAFGCGHDNEGSFAGADGILGLGQGALSFPSQLAAVFNGKFSYCLVDWLAPATQTSALLFGDAAMPVLPNVTYLPLLANPKVPAYYYVKLSGITVGATRLNISSAAFDIDRVGGAGVIFDSGTTVTHLAEPAYQQVLAEMNASTIAYPRVADDPSGLELCLGAVAPGQLPAVPGMTFHFEGGDMVLPPSNFFIFVEGTSSYCFSMVSSPDVTIIGSVQQQNFQVYYDTLRQQIGFVPKSCVGR